MKKETELQKLTRQRREANARYEERHRARRAKKARERRLKAKKARVEKPATPTVPDWSECFRSDGRVENVCPCGVGHPDKRKTIANRREFGRRPLWQDGDGVHGCCAAHCASDAPKVKP